MAKTVFSTPLGLAILMVQKICWMPAMVPGEERKQGLTQSKIVWMEPMILSHGDLLHDQA